MANIPVIVWVEGKVRKHFDRKVEAYAGRTGGQDPESGRYVSPAAPRPAYDVLDLTVDTDPGGLITVAVMPEALLALGGDLTGLVDGDVVRVPVRTYVNWVGPSNRRSPVCGFSLAAEVFTEQRSKTAGGARALSSASA